MFIAIPLIIAVLGVLAYALSVNPKVQMLGLIAFAIGFFYFVGNLAGLTK